MGVRRQSDATQITVSPEQNTSDLVFNVPRQQTFAITGTVATSNNSALRANTMVILVSADGSFLGPMSAAEVSSDGSFAIPKVLPARYIALVEVESDSRDSEHSKWSTIKTELIVDRNPEHLALTLIPEHK